MLEYFCYVSERKVDMLLEQLEDYSSTSRTEEHSVEKQKGISPSLAKLLSLFSLGIKFGKADRIVVSEVKHRTVVQRLQRVLTYLAETESFPDLTDVVVDQHPVFDSVYYSYSGPFTVTDYDKHYAHLRSPVSAEIELCLTCSMGYFSDMGRDGESYVPHSSNAAFFAGRAQPLLKAVLVMQDYKAGVLYASPLCLSILPIHGLDL